MALDAAGTIMVDVTDTNQCTNTDTLTLNVNPLPIVDHATARKSALAAFETIRRGS